jgi:hypothetical protein
MTSLIHKINLIVVLFYLTSQFSFSQERGYEIKLPEGIKYSEELFVQTDRDIYVVGESVLFKIFKLNGITRTPGNISKVVYIELLDDFNNPVTQLKVGVNGFSGSGELRLPETLQTGNYLIRSCTNWMQNFPGNLFSYKRISVINPFEDINKIKIPVSGQQPDSIVFYPEGGSLVSGIETVVGFRCFNSTGMPAAITGIIMDSDNDTLCRVKTDYTGYGFFSVKPSRNRENYLISGQINKNGKKFPLPPVMDTGIALSVKISPDNNFFKIRIQRNGNKDTVPKKISLFYSPGSLGPVKKELTLGTDTMILLSKDSLPYGLTNIRIIDEDGSPVAGRWVYNERKEHLNYKISLQNQTYSTREKVKIDITATDTDGNPVKSDLMISVVKSFAVDKTNCSNLPGLMQLPVLATMAKDKDHFDLNDYLIFYSNEGILLNTDKNSSEVISPYLPELRGHLVSGIIRNTTTGNSINNENIVLSFVGETARCSFSKTDNNGCFNFVINEFGTREIVIQPMSPALNDYYVELDNPFPESSVRYKTFPFYPDSSQIAEINNAIISMQVKNIYEPFLKRNIVNPVYEEPDFFGEPDDTVIISRFIELNSLREIINELVPWINIYKNNGKSKFRLLNGPLSLPFEKDPFMIVDGVPVYDPDLILTIDPGELKKIELLRERYLVSDIILEGIIHFITKKGNLSALEFDKPVFRREFETLQLQHRFDNPDYSTDTLKNSRIPDFRNTLYWNPDLNTGDSGKTTVEFYTSDEPGEYTIIVEGMTSDGKTCRSEMRFLVSAKNSPAL